MYFLKVSFSVLNGTFQLNCFLLITIWQQYSLSIMFDITYFIIFLYLGSMDVGHTGKDSVFVSVCELHPQRQLVLFG